MNNKNKWIPSLQTDFSFTVSDVLCFDLTTGELKVLVYVIIFLYFLATTVIDKSLEQKQS